MPQTIIESTTQQFLDIHDITNDLVIMKNGTAALIVSIDAMNFGLLAEEEQDAVMYAYAGLLNSLNYPIQIVIRSQTKDVTGYLGLLKEQEDKATLRKNQQRISRYREFVANLIHDRNVLDKKFYVVIPASSLELGFLTAQSVVPGSKAFDITTVEKTVIIEKARNLLEPKRDHIISQFARIGLYSRQLSTQEIIQLFYVSYNPEASEGQGIDESRSYTTPLVKASLEGPAMVTTTPAPGMNIPNTAEPVAPAGAQIPAAPTSVAGLGSPLATPASTLTAPDPAEAPAATSTTMPAATAAPVLDAPAPVAPQTISAPPADPISSTPSMSMPTPSTTPSIEEVQKEINSTLSSLPMDMSTPTGPTPSASAPAGSTATSPTPAAPTSTAPMPQSLPEV